MLSGEASAREEPVAQNGSDSDLEKDLTGRNAEAQLGSTPASQRPKTFIQDLAIFTRIYPSHLSLPMQIAQPFLLLFAPSILYGGELAFALLDTY